MKYILNSNGELETNVAGDDGKNIVLNAREAYAALRLQKQYDNDVAPSLMVTNALGYEVNITTLYAISKRIVSQKFFQVAPADYMPLRVGENAWSDNILTYRDYALGGDFEAGNINTGASNSRLAEADSGVDTIVNPVINWAKQINWSFPDLKMAARSGNWDLVTAKEKSRKTNWDLGIQQIAFLGSKSNTNVQGLLNQSTVNANTTLITKYISSMNAAEFTTLVQGMIEAYRSNAQRTVYPDRLIMPEADYNGLAVLVPGTAGTFPVPMMNYLLDAFKLITRNPNFQILPVSYADKATNNTISGLNKNVYTLMRYDEDSGRMDIPVDYTNTMQNTINGFQFQNVGFGQYTGFLAYRPLEFLYFTF